MEGGLWGDSLGWPGSFLFYFVGPGTSVLLSYFCLKFQNKLHWTWNVCIVLPQLSYNLKRQNVKLFFMKFNMQTVLVMSAVVKVFFFLIFYLFIFIWMMMWAQWGLDHRTLTENHLFYHGSYFLPLFSFKLSLWRQNNTK